MIEMKSASAEIFIYGDITSDKWTDADTTAKSFVDELNTFDGKNITVHVNSPGGDVFSALAIHNALKNYGGQVTATVDGLAASAASLIVCGADKVVMASNALMMLHMPAAVLSGYYNAAELAKVRDMLTATESAIVDTYKSRLNRSDSPLNARIDVRTMLESETWLTARDALKWGFADEIAEAVDLQVDNAKKVMVVNSLQVDIKKFDEKQLRRALEANNMTNKIQTPAVNGTGFYTEKTVIETRESAVDVADIRAQEVNRIRSLMKLRGVNPVIDAMVDVAIERGHTVAEFQPYFDAAAKSAGTSTPAEKISAVIRDQMNSGAEGVTGGQTPADKLSAQQNAIVNFANGGK